MMHHAQIAQRAFNTPLMVDPAKALAFLSGLGPRITGQEINFAGLDGGTVDHRAVTPAARGSLFGSDLAQRHQQTGSQPFAFIDGIAVIEIAGTLVHRGSWIGQSSGLTSYEGIAAQLQAALADTSVRGIALDIDSFGGEVAGAFDLADRIRAARAQKPVQAFVAEHALVLKPFAKLVKHTLQWLFLRGGTGIFALADSGSCALASSLVLRSSGTKTAKAMNANPGSCHESDVVWLSGDQVHQGSPGFGKSALEELPGAG